MTDPAIPTDPFVSFDEGDAKRVREISAVRCTKFIKNYKLTLAEITTLVQLLDDGIGIKECGLFTWDNNMSYVTNTNKLLDAVFGKFLQERKGTP